jgi:3-dehydroquinate synthase
MTRIIEQKLRVPFEFPVVFTDGVFASDNSALLDAMDRLRENRRHRAAVFVDENVACSRGTLIGEIETFFEIHSAKIGLAALPKIIPGGETVKNAWIFIEPEAAWMLDLRLDRHSFVIIIGGGAVLDAVGLAASLVHRGLRIVRVPTTVLAQADGGVGVKTGVNFHGGKNALGTFAPPFAVLNDFQFLVSLPDREWRGGVAEAFKVAMIRDQLFFRFLIQNAPQIREHDTDTMRQLVIRCAELHLEHIRINNDPFEFGRARPLDFGHWSAHKLEALSRFTISHGDAVAIGILLDSCYAVEQGWLAAADFDALYRGLEESGFPLWFHELDEAALFDGLREFQEHLGGELCITFPDGLGAGREVHAIDLPAMRRALAELKHRHADP